MIDLTILGSTGSIGKSALRVVDAFPERFRLRGISCAASINDLAEQIKKYRPCFAAVTSATDSQISHLRSEFPDTEIFCGPSALVELVKRGSDIVLNAVVGAAGLLPTIESLKCCRRLAIANKETLVVAGDIVMSEALAKGVELVPVDSEHSAIFMLLDSKRKDDLRRVILTASGGSLRDRSIAEMAAITPEEALCHPTWNMGSKITIDSATLINKGLEVIEAHHLFQIPYEKIDVVIHPESVIHSMIETADGAIYAHMGVADMALPIMNALFHPEKSPNPFGFLDFSRLKSLTFREYDANRFPALNLCYEAGRTGGSATAALNAANEIAVSAFLDRRIRFTDIVTIIRETVSKVKFYSHPSLDELLETDRCSRDEAEKIIRSMVK